MTDRFDRRTFLKGAGTVALAGVAAGCSGGGGDGDSSPTDGGDGGNETVEAPEAVATFLEGANNYDGVVDMTGESEVVVDVGAGANGFAFAPAAVQVDAGTTISWQWTGEGGSHNVVSASDSTSDFDSGNTKQSGDPFEQSFDNTGNMLYYCTPHRQSGMLGAVVVVEG